MRADVHIDEARRNAIKALSDILEGDGDIEKAVLGQDIFGLLRVILWLSPGAAEAAIRARVAEALAPSGHFWTGEIWVCSATTPRADELVYAAAWEEGIKVPDVARLRIDERTRTRTAWLPRFRVPIWRARPDWLAAKAEKETDGTPSMGPPIVVFYSFKGGVGRTTTLAAFALQLAKEGKRVLVIDLDLDAPGVGSLLSRDSRGLGDIPPHTPRGVVDYLLEAPLGEVRLEDYTHRCRRESLLGENGGEIVVIPAGSVDENYLGKLSRLDLEVRGEQHPLVELLVQARDEVEPDWILIDSRAGLSPAAGLLLDGIAHTHVLLGTNSVQSQLGLRLVIQNLGEERILRDLPQAKCVVVQAMVVDVVDVEKAARAQFQAWLETTMRDHYFVAADQEPEEDVWSVRQIDEPESPSQSIAIPYSYRLAFFPSIDDVAKNLVAGPYLELGARILGQFRFSPDSAVDEGGR
jgi:MinD-like ATPase involved in chromosome partitioning or flagellar assembly